MLYTVDAPHFNAGFEYSLVKEEVVNAAPIISYMIGWDMFRVKAYCKNKGWEIYDSRRINEKRIRVLSE